MTQPGHVAPAAPGWWVRTNRVGTAAYEYGFTFAVTGGRDYQGAATGTYGWVGSAAGRRPQPTFVGSAVGTTSATIPTHQVGDIIVVYGVNDNFSSAPPVKPAAGGTVPNFTYIDHPAGASSIASTTAYFVATATTTTTGTWTDLTYMIVAVLRNQNATTPIGGHAESGGASFNDSVAPAVTLSNTTGSSALLHFTGRAGNVSNTAWAAAPAGYTHRTSSGAVICLTTKDVTTSDGTLTRTTDGSFASGYRGATVEILS